MPITFTVEDVDSISMEQIIEIQKFISDRSKSITYACINLVPGDPLTEIVLSDYVNIESWVSPLKLTKPQPRYKTLENKRNLKRDSFK